MNSLRALIAPLAVALSMVWSLGALSQSTSANGVPQLVKLTYVEGLSNFGPKDAEGVLEFSFAEAYARVDVKGLKPEPGYTYEGWLLAPSGDALKVGSITLSPTGVGVLDTRLEKLQSYDYRTFVVAARAAASEGAAIPQQRSIAGVFEVLGARPGASARGDILPGVLPDTGEHPPLSTMERVVRTAGVMAAMTTISLTALVLIRRRKASHD